MSNTKPQSPNRRAMSEMFDHGPLPHQFDALHLTTEQEDSRKAPPSPPPELGTDNDDSEVEEGWDTCMVCLIDSNHSAAVCPYRRSLPEGAKLGTGWIPACRICGDIEFDPELKTCIECGHDAKFAFPIFCGCCGDEGHKFEDCKYKDFFDKTSLSYYHPPRTD